jgi:hypothetical protein
MMRAMPELPDDDIDEYLRSLPAAADSWVARAEELPRLELALAAVPADCEEGDLEALRTALRSVGLEPDDRRVQALARLRELRRES